jgi:hypothetical protein
MTQCSNGQPEDSDGDRPAAGLDLDLLAGCNRQHASGRAGRFRFLLLEYWINFD